MADKRDADRRSRDLARALFKVGAGSTEVAELFGVAKQQAHQWIGDKAELTIEDDPNMLEALRADAKSFAPQRRKILAKARDMGARAKKLAVEVDQVDGYGPSDFCDDMGIERRQFYYWLGKSYTKRR